jgi:hypothetical protein
VRDTPISFISTIERTRERRSRRRPSASGSLGSLDVAMPGVQPDLADERSGRWWHGRPPVRSLSRAAAFVDDVGFALLFGLPDGSMPSLYEATRGGGSGGRMPGLEDGWSADAERVWGWKDLLPQRGMAWYGRFVRGRSSLLSPGLLRDLYPRSGEPADFEEEPLSVDGAKIAQILLLNGPTSTTVLREATAAVGPRGRARFDKAVAELGKKLVVTHLGVEDQDAGWPAARLELTARAFEVGSPTQQGSGGAARLRSARRYLDTMVQARPHELGNAFGWGADAARLAFEELVALGQAVRVGPAYRLSREARTR